MKRAYIVTGAEATGTKMVTSALLSAGCEGDLGNEQWLLKALLFKYQFECETVALRISMPHGLEWYDLGRFLWHFHSLGYECRVLVTVRDSWAVTASHMKDQTHAFNREHSENKKQRAYLEIFQALQFSRVPYILVPYESIVARPQQAIGRLMAWCGLSIAPENMPNIHDANEKWYENPETAER